MFKLVSFKACTKIVYNRTFTISNKFLLIFYEIAEYLGHLKYKKCFKNGDVRIKIPSIEKI